MKITKAMSVLACCGMVLMVACSKDSSTTKKSGSPGAVSDKACCTEKSGTECTDKAAAPAKAGSMGAVSEKSGCCSGDAKKTN